MIFFEEKTNESGVETLIESDSNAFKKKLAKWADACVLGTLLIHNLGKERHNRFITDSKTIILNKSTTIYLLSLIPLHSF